MFEPSAGFDFGNFNFLKLMNGSTETLFLDPFAENHTRFAVGVGPSFSTGFHSDRPVWGAIAALGLGLAPWAMTDYG